jgi:excinuclease ABC subunit C
MAAEGKFADHLNLILKTLPENPGVYQYYDTTGQIIYVGKAKNLRKRVLTYFNKDQTGFSKVAVLVRKIADIRFIIVDSELDALLLENNLIKKYQPRYNVLLKDDKTYPWICIKNEPFPRIFPTRNLIQDGSDYFGPYASGRMMHTLLELIRQLYPLRTCTFRLSEENIQQGKFKLCLQYHIGNCKGPCTGLQTAADYEETLRHIRDIIKGNIHTVTQHLRSMMMDFSRDLAFEKAQIVKEKLEHLERYQSRSTIVNPNIDNVDVFSIISEQASAFVNFMKIVHGAIIQAHTIEIKKKLDESDEELLILGIMEFRTRFSSNAKEILVPIPLELDIPGLSITIPQRGDKKKLLELSDRNVRYFQHDKHKQLELVDPERHTQRILNQMKTDLRLPSLPERIECFDNSNIQGEYPVAAMVVFKNARPEKREYRHFNIKTVEGPNDFASMEEIIYRRYKRMIDEEQPLPQLIVVDGGKGQLSSAVKSLEKLNLYGVIPIIGIAKKLEEIYYPNDPVPLYIDKKSESLRIIQQLRDEAHRFGITHHRQKRQKETIKSVLTEIPGVGYETAQKLLWKLKSVKRIAKTPLDELQKVIGKSKAGIVFNYFKEHPLP